MLHVKRRYIALSSLTFCALSFPALAQENPNEFKAVIACTNITDATERLECYDLAAGRLATAQKSGEIVAINKKDIEKVERDAFGFNIPSLPSLFGLGKSADNSAAKTKTPKPRENPLTSPVEAPNPKNTQKSVEIRESKIKSVKPPSVIKPLERPQVKEVTLDIAKTTEFGRGKTRFFLANGQVWEQTNAEKFRIPKVRNGRLNQAEITKASFGSFNLRVNGKGRAVKVKRVR